MKTLMVKQNSNPAQFMTAPKPPQYSSEWGFEPSLIVSPQRTHSPVKSAPLPSATPIQLELDALNCFEIVENQFQVWGITFKNAIALQPSNPAFITQANQVVLMSGPNSGFLEICFQYPPQLIKARIISSQSTVLSAFNAKHQEVACTHTLTPETTPAVGSVLPPTLLQIRTPDIHKVTFSTFDGQLIIDYLELHF